MTKEKAKERVLRAAMAWRDTDRAKYSTSSNLPAHQTGTRNQTAEEFELKTALDELSVAT